MDRSKQNTWFLVLVLFLTGQCFGIFGDHELSEDGNKVIWNNNSQKFSIAASDSMSETVDYLWPAADGTSSQAMITDGSSVLSFADVNGLASTVHDILSATHGDILAASVSRGSLIYGNATPKWAEKTIGTNDFILISDGTDFDWANVNLAGILDHTLSSTWFAIQGGDTDEFFHLDDPEHVELVNWLDDVILYDNGDTDLVTHDFNSTGKVRAGLALFGGVGIFRTPDQTGAGTVADPILIYDVTQLQAMDANLAGSYKLARDIDATGFVWTPVGVSGDRFTGTFDGDGFIITFLTITKTGLVLGQGLFGYVSGVTIEDVVLQNVSMVYPTFLSDSGALVGDIIGVTIIQDCYVSGEIDCGSAGFSDVGGLIGKINDSSNHTIVQRCGSVINLIGASNGVDDMGSLIGFIRGDVEILNCYARGSVTYPDSGLVLSTGIGALIGHVTETGAGLTVTNCYTTGAVSAKNLFEESRGQITKGGFIGVSFDRAETYTDCFWDNETTGTLSAGDGKNEVQRYTMTGNATSGTYDIIFDGSTATMDYDDIQSVIQTTMDSEIGTDEITVWTDDGGKFDAGANLYLIFNENHFETDVNMTTFVDNLTNGTINAPTEHQTATASIGDAADIRGKTTVQMQAQATFDTAGSIWDFTTIWQIEEGEGYPTLQAFSEFDSATTQLHRFGTTITLFANVIANSKDNVLIEGDLEIQGTQLVLGDGTATDTTLFFNSLTNDGSIIWDESDAEFDFGTSKITTTGVVSGQNVTSGENPGHTHTGDSLSLIDIVADTNLAVTAPITLTGPTIGWDSTLIDATTWSDGTNTTNQWIFDVCDTDHTMTAGDGVMTFSAGLVADTDTLVVDAVNHRVGVGTASPGRDLSVSSSSANTYFQVTNNALSGGAAVTGFEFIVAASGFTTMATREEGFSFTSAKAATFNANNGAVTFNASAGTNIFKTGGTTTTLLQLSTSLDQATWGVYDAVGNQFIFTNGSNVFRDHDHDLVTDLTIYIHSDLDPRASNNQWGSLHHDQENFIITSGANVGDGTAPTTIENAIILAPRGTEGIRVTGAGVLLASNKVAFTQTDLNEYIDSLNDGYMDYGATTGHRFNNDITAVGTGTFGDLVVNTTGEIQFRDADISIGSTLTDGILDMSADDAIYMFYDNADVGDAVDGQSLYIYRRAGEYDKYIRFYTDQFGESKIEASYSLDLLLGATAKIRVQSTGILLYDKLVFTQTDLNEYIDSLNDGYMDYGATTGHRFNNDVTITGISKLGDGGSNVTKIGATGDLSFTGTAGFIYGHMYVPGTDITVETSGTANPVEVKDDGTVSANDGWALSYENSTTFAVSDLHYITVEIAGTYEVIWDMSPSTVAGGGTVIHGGITIDTTTFQRDNGEGHAHTFNTNDNIQINGVGVVDCPNGNEEISLWVSNNAAQKTVIEHGSMRIKLIGGT